MATGNMDPDFVRTSSLFSFQCVLSLKRFVPVVIHKINLVNWPNCGDRDCWWTFASCGIFMWSSNFRSATGDEFRDVGMCLVYC